MVALRCPINRATSRKWRRAMPLAFVAVLFGVFNEIMGTRIVFTTTTELEVPTSASNAEVYPEESHARSLTEASQQQESFSPNIETRIQANVQEGLPNLDALPGPQHTVPSLADHQIQKLDQEEESLGDILIVVATCKKNFAQRVKTIAQTWARNPTLPENHGLHNNTKGNISVWYFLGDLHGDYDNVTRPLVEAGLVRPSSIKEMKGVPDDEYPPVRRNTKMAQFVARELEQKNNHNKVQWIVKVDDDTYVNTAALRGFLAKGNPKNHHYHGLPGEGREGKDRAMLQGGPDYRGPFCMGGPGYVMSYRTWRETARGMDQCLSKADASSQRPVLWHSDVIMGMCVHEATKKTCTVGTHTFQFRQGYDTTNVETFVPDEALASTITMHAFKNPGSMERVHHRYRHLATRLASKKEKMADQAKTGNAPDDETWINQALISKIKGGNSPSDLGKPNPDIYIGADGKKVRRVTKKGVADQAPAADQAKAGNSPRTWISNDGKIVRRVTKKGVADQAPAADQAKAGNSPRTWISNAGKIVRRVTKKGVADQAPAVDQAKTGNSPRTWINQAYIFSSTKGDSAIPLDKSHPVDGGGEI